MSTRKDLPPTSSPNFLEKVREALSVYLGNRGDKLDRGVTLRDLTDAGIVALRAGYQGGDGPISGPGPSIGSGGTTTTTAVDLTPPPTPTGFRATAGLNHIFLEHDAATYLQGHGHARTVIFGVTYTVGQVYPSGQTLPIFTDALAITEFTGTIFSYPASLGTTWHLWAKWLSVDGVVSNLPAGDHLGGIHGEVATTGKIGNTDLGPLIVEAGNLANGSVSATKLAAQAIEATKFANGIEPLSVVAALPAAGGYTGPKMVFLTTDGKLYRYVSGAWTTAVAAPDLTGTINMARIADGSLAGTKFASGIEPITVVTGALPGVKSTSTIFLTSDQKLYRWSGTAYVASVPVADLSGQLLTNQLVDGAITAVKIGAAQVTAAKTAIAAIDPATGNLTANSVTANTIKAGEVIAGKLATDAVVALNIQAGAITTAKMTAGTINANVLSAGTITTGLMTADAINGDRITSNTLAAGKIVAGSITTTELQANGVNANRLTAGTITTDLMTANTINGDRILTNTLDADKILANSITAGKIQAGAIGVDQIAAGAITTNKLLVTGKGAALNDDPYTLDLTAWTFSGASLVTDTTCPVGTSVIETSTNTWGTSRPMPLDAARNYQYRFWIKAQAGTCMTYGMVQFFDANGTTIFSTGGTWAGEGSYNYFGLVGGSAPAGWTEYVISFGPGEAAKIPAGAKTFAVGAILNYNGSTSPTSRVAGLRVFEKAAADMIVDGSIIASKLSAGAIAVNTAAIQSGAIINFMLGDGTIESAKIQNLAVISAKINNLAVTNAKIDNLAVTAAKIADLTVTAAKIADLTVTAAKIADLAVTNAKIGSLAVNTLQIANNAVTYTDTQSTGGITSYVQVGDTTAPTTTSNAFLTFIGAGGRVHLNGTIMCLVVSASTSVDSYAITATVRIEGSADNVNWYYIGDTGVNGASLAVARGMGTTKQWSGALWPASMSFATTVGHYHRVYLIIGGTAYTANYVLTPWGGALWESQIYALARVAILETKK